MLDVHKIQFVLAATANPDQLMQVVLQQIEKYRREYTIPSESELRAKFALPNRFDTGEVRA